MKMSGGPQVDVIVAADSVVVMWWRLLLLLILHLRAYICMYLCACADFDAVLLQLVSTL